MSDKHIYQLQSQLRLTQSGTNEISHLISLFIFSSLYSQSHPSFGSTTSLTTPSPISSVSKIIFIIDDIHFADESSLKHLLTLGSHKKSLLILSMKPPRNNSNHRSNSNVLQSIITNKHVYLRRLRRLERRYLATLGNRKYVVDKLNFLISKI